MKKKNRLERALFWKMRRRLGGYWAPLALQHTVRFYVYQVVESYTFFNRWQRFKLWVWILDEPLTVVPSLLILVVIWAILVVL